MVPQNKIVQLLAEMRESDPIQKTESTLQKKTLSAQEKMVLGAFNQENRLSIIKRVQKHTFDNVFLAYPDNFYTKKHHYDWWVFPMHVPVEWKWERRNYDASINLDEAQTLLYDEEFVATYTSCVSLYIDALEKHGWNDYPVRYMRMLQSVGLFIEAASQMEGMDHIYTKLGELGEVAVNYASEKKLNAKYPTYTLLLEGYAKAVEEVDKFKDHCESNCLKFCPF